MSYPRTWDIYCRVVDNYGDIGVCWRLARLLARRPGAIVRLWVDDLASLRMLAPETDTTSAVQNVAGIEVHRWTAPLPDVTPADVCIEGFGCGLPEPYVVAMVQRTPRTLWIVLEYLSGEPWVREYHGLASPHPQWPLQRYFFFPGFERGTGGLLREADLLERQERYAAGQRQRYWTEIGFRPPPDDARVVSIFGYPYAPLLPLLEHWSRAEGSWIAAVPVGALATEAARYFGAARADPGVCLRRGNVELRVLPFVPQDRFDEFLWCCDCNFVRGEDSFVRAQWAQRPFVWHIYPQDAEAHRLKLEAFLDLYCAALPASIADAVQGLWRAWNQLGATPVAVGPAWARYWAARENLLAHGRTWARQLAAVGELAENLAQFCRDKLK